MSRDSRIDTYIAKAAPFAQPILAHIRDRVHAIVPDVTETLKWGAPAFLKGKAILVIMAAFKAHAALNFWRGSELGDGTAKPGAMGQLGKLASVDDLPANLDDLIAEAAALAATAPAPRKPKAAPKPPAGVHPDLAAALDRSAAAKRAWDAFSPSAKRDYADWVAEAKRDATRASRVTQAIEWMAKGKKRHWKYENC